MQLPGVRAPVTHAKPHGKGQIRLGSIADLDGRTAAYRNAMALREAICADLGGEDTLSSVKLKLIDSLVLLTAVIEHYHTAILSGDGSVDLQALNAATNTRNRTAQLVGMDRVQRDITDIAEYLKATKR